MPDSLEWPEDVIVREIVTGQDRKRLRGRQFIYCEDLEALKKASALPGKAGWVWLLTWHRSRVANSRWITLPQSCWMDGASADPKSPELWRSYRQLEW